MANLKCGFWRKKKTKRTYSSFSKLPKRADRGWLVCFGCWPVCAIRAKLCSWDNILLLSFCTMCQTNSTMDKFNFTQQNNCTWMLLVVKLKFQKHPMHCSGDYLVYNLGRQSWHFSMMVLCQLLRCSSATGYFDIYTEPPGNAVSSSKPISNLLPCLHLYIILLY